MDNSILYEEGYSYRWLYPVMRLLAFWAALKKSSARLIRLPAPKVNSFFFDGLGPVCRAIKEGAGSWKALHLIYNYKFPEPTSIGGLVDNLWLRSPNAQAVRNRHRIVNHEIYQVIRDYSISNQEVRLLSLAAGSAEGLLAAMAKSVSQGMKVRCLLIDVDETAGEYAMKVAAELGISHLVQTRKANVTSVSLISQTMREFKPQIVEMLGLLDYLKDQKAINLIRTIRQGLPVSGRFYTCNIIPNAEQAFLKHVLDWDMIYRTPVEVQRLFTKAGFAPPKLMVEPMEIHVIGIGEVVQAMDLEAA